jgi:4-hydroxy-tetrahydrodipicolinate reductase
LDVDPLNIKSIRAGGIVGVHEVVFGFPQQTVRIRHESITREAFGHGALFVAERLVGMPPGLYKMDDLLLPYFGTGHSAGEVAVTLCEDCHAKPPSLLPMP